MEMTEDMLEKNIIQLKEKQNLIFCMTTLKSGRWNSLELQGNRNSNTCLHFTSVVVQVSKTYCG